jgi:hypothetical protein
MSCKCCGAKHATIEQLRACQDAVGQALFVNFLADYYATARYAVEVTS